MTSHRHVIGMMLLAALGCGNGQTFADDYSSVSIQRAEGYGFCPVNGMILNGSTTRSDGVLGGTRAKAGDPARDTCLDPYGARCMVSEEFAPVTLSPAELEELRARVAAVPEKDCDTTPNLACDYCLVTTITVDKISESPFCCGELNEEFSTAFESLASYLDGLAANAR